MSSFVVVANLDRLSDRRGTLVEIGGEEIALFRRNDEVYAINNVCAHQHFSKLHEGRIAEYEVTCPMHGWAYDMRTGLNTTGQGKVASYPVRVVGNDVMLLIEAPESQ